MNKELSEEMKKFLDILEETLEEQGYSIPQFAKEMEVAKVTVYRWLNGETIMSLEHYYKALKILNITI